ncbi:hypothetical protein PILCRDRAFT_822445 [Piloderma croceum F 1598]|uniref:Uncharacterized protein n=1 Tax=Piloderma croceum (strain F 1598) TaxID=765440 RepID=A0A0C3B274_PILCF|nr:hypothetical protein PILCRDRAFT_822445 [Piloderma croceum F 1598]
MSLPFQLRKRILGEKATYAVFRLTFRPIESVQSMDVRQARLREPLNSAFCIMRNGSKAHPRVIMIPMLSVDNIDDHTSGIPIFKMSYPVDTVRSYQ